MMDAMPMTGIMPVMDVNGNSNNNGGFGDGAWSWIWIILIFAIFFNNGNFGGFGNSGGSGMQGALTRGDLCMDMNFQDVQNGVRNISDQVGLGFANLNSTICNQQYDTAGLINGVNQNISNLGYSLNSTLCQGFNGLNVALLQGNNALQSQIAQCCCETNRSLDAMNFANAQNTCSITNAIATSTRDIVDNQNANYRALHDEIVANRIEDKNAQIQAQQNEINKLQLAASQSAQNAYLIDQLSPKFPVPAYLTCNPYTGQVYGGYGYNGYNGGCGCNCGC